MLQAVSNPKALRKAVHTRRTARGRSSTGGSGPGGLAGADLGAAGRKALRATPHRQMAFRKGAPMSKLEVGALPREE